MHGLIKMEIKDSGILIKFLAEEHGLIYDGNPENYMVTQLIT